MIIFVMFAEALDSTCDYYNNDWSTYHDDYKMFLKNYFLAQIDGYEKGNNGLGWYFWTGKTENNCGPEWDFIFLIQNGIIPDDLCNRPVFCNYTSRRRSYPMKDLWKYPRKIQALLIKEKERKNHQLTRPKRQSPPPPRTYRTSSFQKLSEPGRKISSSDLSPQCSSASPGKKSNQDGPDKETI